ncbi:MAG: UDP-glucose:undecaprenyl-phosphate glucose-1-phosphate transferase [Owenweeksia sp. TMED14]|nr:MAG: UDP-glucose:undecaprenyl-phosphate glucose-1-phosphate transferase [Owenweeksia sp. TMED14]
MEARGLKSSELVFFLLDAAILASSFLLWVIVRLGDLSEHNPEYYGHYLILFILVFVFWMSLSLFFSVHKVIAGVEIRNVLSSFYKMVFLHLSFISLIIFILKTSIYYSRIFLFLFILTYLLFGTILRFIWFRALRKYYLKGNGLKSIAIVGNGEQWERLSMELDKHPEYGYQIGKRFRILTDLPELSKEWEELWVVPDDLIEASVIADNWGIRLRLVPDLGVLGANRTRLSSIGNIPIVELRPEPLSNYFMSGLKRLFDIVISLIGLVLILSWVIPILGLLILINSKGTVFYSQIRIGTAGNNFKILKFRSMYSGVMDNIQAQENDNRITYLGRIIRRTHLDELPQLWNVFTGDMSLVGPRPHMLADHDVYTKAIKDYGIRHWVRPGITGLAQARGLTGSKNMELMGERIRTDIYYIENWSFILDLKIIVATLLGARKWI